MKKTVWAGVVFAALVVGYVMYSSFGAHPYKCEVCMVFHGGRDCRTASADTRENALRTAITNACAQLASGVTESSQCEGTEPERVTWK
jgi:hypothetical protein